MIGAGRYFAPRYWAARYWAKAGGEAPAGEVQPHGIIVISAEPRSVLIPSDAARIQIDAQPNRILISH